VKNLILAAIVGILGIPTLALGQTEPPEYLWALEYSDSHGITVHRLLNDKWEVFLGGWINNYDYTDDFVEYRYSESDGYELHLTKFEENSRRSRQLHLGLGRSLWQENNFRFSGLVRFEHYWSEFEELDEALSPDSPLPASRKKVGHSNTTSVYLGLRPAYDITPRIALLLEFGLVYKNSSYTNDTMNEDPDNLSWYGNEESRASNSTDRVNLYGYNSLYSISLMFRF